MERDVNYSTTYITYLFVMLIIKVVYAQEKQIQNKNNEEEFLFETIRLQ